jgi:hypothetical protein
MGQTTDQIERHIEHKRADLKSNLRELETRAKSATDWRHYFKDHTWTMIAAAFARSGRPCSLSRRRVHRHMRLPTPGAGVQMDATFGHRKRYVRRNHINVVSHGRNTVACLEHRQLGFTSQDLRQKTLMATIQV